ncbi:hypothetical protein JOF29_002277 [Kribbella aluminosa]|uniref:DUF4345 domain-containing protein n=1 Tax=Kribbella aluminosa TaxID=416017 RepID=A0ABS4UHV0_9ACTN|nr:hypothetical protein [Kribbella aluminosa]MBP2351194.1 hypothetical protein [Kribbella aluminosa]
MSPHKRSYLTIVRISAWYDLLVTAGFATPWTFVLVHRVLSSVGTFPPADTMQMLFANLMGSVVVVWSLLRLLRTLPLHGLYDGFARGLFACWQAYALAHGASRVLLAFLVVEVSFGVLQLLPWLRDALRGRGRTRPARPPVR